MKQIWLRVFALSAGTILSVVAGNASLGYGVKSASSQAVFSLLLNPWIIAGIVLQLGWMLFRMALLSITPMSIILPLTAGVSYMLTGVTSVLFLHERLSHGQWWGLALIFVGVLVIGASDSNKAEEPGP